MKNKFFKLKIVFTFFILMFSNFSYLKVYANSYTTFVYAKVNTSGVYLYRTANSLDVANAYFEIPKSYFVLLVSNIDNVFYKAQYKDVVGYVKKDEVVPVKEKPNKPYLDDVKFWVYSTDGANVVSKTFSINEQVTLGSVKVMQELTYYGTMVGDEFIKNRGYLWLYYKNEDCDGYLYKGLCDLSCDIVENNEVVTISSNPFLDNDNSYLYNLIDMQPIVKVVLIMFVTLPCFLIVYLLFKPFKISEGNEKPKLRKSENKNKKVKNRTINKIQEIIDDNDL